MNEMIKNAVELKDGKAVTTSLKIAEVFGKDHANVLKAIRNIEAPVDFAAVNFNGGSYKDANNQDRPMYFVTRDGFTLLAMGFTGKAAMQFKVAYIEAFNAMERTIRESAAGNPPLVRGDAGDTLQRDGTPDQGGIRTRRVQAQSPPYRHRIRSRLRRAEQGDRAPERHRRGELLQELQARTCAAGGTVYSAGSPAPRDHGRVLPADRERVLTEKWAGAEKCTEKSETAA